MKQLSILAIAVAVLFAGVSNVNAQPGKISFGIGADVALPIASGFSDSQGIGIGGTAKVYYPINDMFTLNGTAGYITFAGKDYTVAGLTTSVKAGSWNMVPVLVGGRYYFTPASSAMRWYGMFDMGLIFGSYTTPDQTISVFGFTQTIKGASVSTTDFSYQPGVGFEASKWDVAVRLLGVSGAASVAARIGYMF